MAHFSRQTSWPEHQYPAKGRQVNAVRAILQKYHDLAMYGPADQVQPDPRGCLDIDLADAVIEVLLDEQAKELEFPGRRETFWPFCSRPAESMRNLPDSAKLAMFQELIAAYQEPVLRSAPDPMDDPAYFMGNYG